MSGPWKTIEAEVVAKLGGLTAEGAGGPLLATVRGYTARDRKQVVGAVMRERLPAAYVMLTGRDGGDKDYRRAGAPLVSVVYAARSERCDDEARHGGVDVVGVMPVAAAGACALHHLALDGGGRLLLVEERAVTGEEGTALWEQRYEVRRLSGGGVPKFGGAELLSPSSVVEVHIGEITRASSRFAFPGVDGVFERFAGMRERPILWRGQLRSSDDVGLNVIEEGLERLAREAAIESVEDPWGRRFDDCVLRSFKRVGPRRQDLLSGEALQDFEIEFVQLAQ